MNAELEIRHGRLDAYNTDCASDTNAPSDLGGFHGDEADHPDIAATLHALGGLHQSLGNLEAAKGILEEALGMQRWIVAAMSGWSASSP